MSEATTHRPATVGRLAPSPTGAQHVGNARTYLWAWLSARLQGGRLWLRIEDIDSPRVKPWAVSQTWEDLEWLGLDWDPTPSTMTPVTAPITRPITTDGLGTDELASPGWPAGVWRQTERLVVYTELLERLRASGRLYPCYCTRKDIETAASAPHREDHHLRYPDTCRENPCPAELFPHSATTESGTESTAFGNLQPNRPFAWRFRCQEEVIRFYDAVCGEQTSRPHRDLGDFVIGKSFPQVAYQLAVVVDDHQMGVTEVIRGDDLIPSTFWQLELYQALGWSPPRFCHVPLVVGPDGRRLAKRHGDTRLSEIRRRGLGPERLIGMLGHQGGWLASPAPLSATDLLEVVRQQLREAGWDACVNSAAEFHAAFWRRLPRQPLVLTDALWQSILGGP